MYNSFQEGFTKFVIKTIGLQPMFFSKKARIMIDPLKLIEKYYHKDTELYQISLSHAYSVTNLALKVVEQHPELKLDVQFVREAAMLHDIGIFLCDASKIMCFGTHEYIEHGYLGADLLRAEGLPKHALVCERHTGAGISLSKIQKKKLPIPQRDMRPVSMEEKVICYADKFYSKTKLEYEIPLETVREKLKKHGKSSINRFDRWHEMFRVE
jgi:uncharacterized protein